MSDNDIPKEDRELIAAHSEAQAEMLEAKAKAKRIAAELVKRGSEYALTGDGMCW